MLRDELKKITVDARSNNVTQEEKEFLKKELKDAADRGEFVTTLWPGVDFKESKILVVETWLTSEGLSAVQKMDGKVMALQVSWQ